MSKSTNRNVRWQISSIKKSKQIDGAAGEGFVQERATQGGEWRQPWNLTANPLFRTIYFTGNMSKQGHMVVAESLQSLLLTSTCVWRILLQPFLSFGQRWRWELAQPPRPWGRLLIRKTQPRRSGRPTWWNVCSALFLEREAAGADSPRPVHSGPRLCPHLSSFKIFLLVPPTYIVGLGGWGRNRSPHPWSPVLPVY